jgi:hypothetical protein
MYCIFEHETSVNYMHANDPRSYPVDVSINFYFIIKLFHTFIYYMINYIDISINLLNDFETKIVTDEFITTMT